VNREARPKRGEVRVATRSASQARQRSMGTYPFLAAN